jgi:hypothetical protein
MLGLGLMMMPFMAEGEPVQPPHIVTAVTQPEQTATGAPPVSQVLVPEGYFALKLAAALGLGTPTTEVQAEDMLTAVGITPKNGWIADYPMTPIVIGELQDAVVAASAANKVPMVQNDALQAFQSVISDFGLSVSPGTGQYAESQPPTSSEYAQPTVVNNYYYEEGPPVVTYYPPPQDYYYLYSWVPYPFWYSNFYFPGFFILKDFDCAVVGHFHGHPYHYVITNHFFNRGVHRYVRVNPTMKPIGRGFRTFPTRSPRFGSPEARRGATSIFNHSFERGRTASALTGTTSRRFGEQGRNFSVASGRNFNRPSEGFGRSFSSPRRSFIAPQSSFGESHSGGFGGLQGQRFGESRGGGFHGHSFGESHSGAGGFQGHGFGESHGGGFHGQSFGEYHGGGFGGFHGHSFGGSHGGGFGGFHGGGGFHR